MKRLAWLVVVVGCGGDAVPPVAALVPATDTNPDPDVVEVTLVAAESVVDLGAGPTRVMGYRDGALADAPVRVPGPLIEAKVGDRLIVHFRNELATPSTIHWHGLRLPIEMDGDPMVVDAVSPGGSYDYDIVLRDAGFYWYHPHVDTDMQIEMGLQGPLVVRGDGEPALRERMFVLDDVDLDDRGQIAIEPSMEDLMLGRRGDTVLVNGGPPGAIDADTVERWRIVNTSNGRFFDLTLGTPMRVIGWDGGLIAEPYDADHVLVAPGERYDVVVRIDRDRVLAAVAYERAHGGRDDAVELVHVHATGRGGGDVPDRGPAIERLATDGAIRRFTLRENLDAGAFLVNDQRWPFNTPIAVALGDTEVWEIANDADGDHPMHVHGHFFQVLDRPLGWKDTIVLPPHTTVRAAVRYEEPGKWMFHCQIPEHAERGMTADVDVERR